MMKFLKRKVNEDTLWYFCSMVFNYHLQRFIDKEITEEEFESIAQNVDHMYEKQNICGLAEEFVKIEEDE